MVDTVHFREHVNVRSQGFPHLCRVRDLDIPPNLNSVTRCGVILCTMINSTLHFCMGRDKNSYQITDFGGSYVRSKDQSPVKAALRELNEETQNTVCLKTNHVKDSLCVYNSNTLIIFYIVRRQVLEKYINDFTKNVNHSQDLEVDKMLYYSKYDIELMLMNDYQRNINPDVMVKDHTIYDRVSDLLSPRIHLIFKILTIKARDYCDVT